MEVVGWVAIVLYCLTCYVCAVIAVVRLGGPGSGLTKVPPGAATIAFILSPLVVPAFVVGAGVVYWFKALSKE